MSHSREQKQRQSTVHHVTVWYLVLFVSWLAPHHIESHLCSDLSASVTLVPACLPTAHHPELCQLCHAQGQVDLVPNGSVALDPCPPVLAVSPQPAKAVLSLSGESLSSRAPPSVA